jgi:AcrR family transcriptional regulator
MAVPTEYSVGTAQKTRKNSDARVTDRRAEIVRAALEVFAERGYRGGSLAAVAERVGLTQQGVLHYFPSKDALLTEVLRLRDTLDGQDTLDGLDPLDGQDTLDCLEMPAAAADRDGLAGLPGIESLVARNATRPGLVQCFTVLAAESVTDRHPAQSFFAARYRTLRPQLAGMLRRELGDPGPSGLTADQASALLIAIMDGLQQQWLLEPGQVDMPGLVSAFADVLRGRG